MLNFCLPPLEVMATTQTRTRRTPTHFGLFVVRWLVAFFFCSKKKNSLCMETFNQFILLHLFHTQRNFLQLNIVFTNSCNDLDPLSSGILWDTKSLLKIKMLESTIVISTIQIHEWQRKAVRAHCCGQRQATVLFFLRSLRSCKMYFPNVF